MTSLLTDNKLKAVAIDAATGKMQGNYSAKEGSEKIRQAMVELFGTDKIDYKTFRNPNTKVEFFAFVEETVTPIVHKKLEETFEKFAEFRNIGYGDEQKFLVPNTELFNVATIAEGSGNIRRKRLEGSEYTVDVSSFAVGIYEEFNRFLAGRVDWATYVQKMADSLSRDIALRISQALYGSFDVLSSTYRASILSTQTETDLKDAVLEIASHVEAEHGAAVILGTKSAIAKLKPDYSNNEQDGERNLAGYFGVVDGYNTMAMPQFHINNTDEFAIDANTILILPEVDEKIVKVVVEGTAIMREANGGEMFRDDMRVNLDIIQRAGVLVLNPRKYGMVKFEI